MKAPRARWRLPTNPCKLGRLISICKISRSITNIPSGSRATFSCPRTASFSNRSHASSRIAVTRSWFSSMKAWPHGKNLHSRVAAYAAVHKHAMELVARRNSSPGGERCKNDLALVERLQRRLVEFALDRHAFVVAIGGWRVHYHIPLFLDDLGPFLVDTALRARSSCAPPARPDFAASGG